MLFRYRLRKFVKYGVISVSILYLIFVVQHFSYDTNLEKQDFNKLPHIDNDNVEAVSASINAKTQLDDIFIAVKTSRLYKKTRLPIIIQTWFQLAKEQTWFFTDFNDESNQIATNGHMINTFCPPTHIRRDLCCKMSVEYDKYLKSNKRWFCHFDDDNYVNIPKLVALLQDYSHFEDWYLGRRIAPIAVNQSGAKKKQFWFATGGAGFCISRALASKMVPFASGGRFIRYSDKYSDDANMGYIIEYLLGVNLTAVDQFHSHSENLSLLPKERFQDQITYSYSRVKNAWNVINIDGFDDKRDPTRFLSIHCYLFPEASICEQRNI